MPTPMRKRGIVVAKLGSSTLVDERFRIDRDFVRSLCDQVAVLVREGYRVVLVSSGAVAAGLDRLGFERRPNDMGSLQACAAAGQVALAEAYGEVLAEYGISCAQVLQGGLRPHGERQGALRFRRQGRRRGGKRLQGVPRQRLRLPLHQGAD